MKLLVIGAGGHARVCADAAAAAWPDADIVGHVDDDQKKHGGNLLGRPVLGPIDSIGQWDHDAIILGIGDNRVRARLFEQLASSEHLPAVVHPRATVAPSASIGAGSVLFAGAVVNPDAVLREDAIVNTGATVDHECVLEAHAHVGPGSHVNGACVLGEGALLTTGVVVGRGVTIGAWTTVGAGAVVLRDLPSQVLAYGVPARIVRRL
jgi:sugar O-acyltransferase (sialic acid O-acetyltransferase NeuD family)